MTEMKTKHIALTFVASVALMLTACINETEFNEVKLDKNGIAFRISTVQTRSAAENQGLGTFEVATVQTGDGDTFVFEESVESLDAGLATRGTPAFTANVLDLYGTFNAVAPNTVDGSKTLPDAEFEFDGTTWWTHHYPGMGELFPAKYQLFMRMPSDIASGKYGLTSAPAYNTDGSIEFDYTSPTTAAGQTDILFTSKTIEKNQEDIYFYHVLTGVKFQNFFTNVENEDRTVAKTNITGVTIEGIKNSGHCKVTPGATTAGSSATVSVWSDQTGKATFSMTATDTTNYKNSTVGLDTLLNKTAGARNVNDDDGTLTFWFVPQTIAASDSVKITVDFDVELVNASGNTTSTKDTTLTLLLGAREWKAGELHTFTLKPTVVGVTIVDDMANFTKSDVVVANTGNVWEYVRVNMIANWVGNVQTAAGVFSSDTTVLMGYAKEHADSMRMVEPWNDKDGKTTYGTFVKLTPQSHQVPAVNGVADSIVNNWVRYDKYYYYIKPIGPDDSITDDLFESYTVGVSPEYWITDKWGTRRKAGNVHLVMDLMVQAIPAPVDKDGNILDNDDDEGYIRAWVKALGKSQPADLLDL